MIALRAATMIGPATLCLLLSAGTAIGAETSTGCKPNGKPVLRATPACQYALPVSVGAVLLVAKACRIPMDGAAVVRHAVEVHDAATGKRLGQASLPAVRVAANAPVPAVGTLLGGPFPLYVFAGGIGAIDSSSRRAELVFEPSGRLAGLARAGEILAVVDALPADATFPKGSLEWTVLDFGKGEMLGQARLAGDRVDGVGLVVRGDGLYAVLDLTGKKGPVTLASRLRDKAGKQKTGDGLLRPKLEARRQAAAKAPKRPAGDTCPVLDIGDAVRTAHTALAMTGPAAKPDMAFVSGWLRVAAGTACIAATQVDGKGRTWAWLAEKRRAVLRGLSCPGAGSKRGK